ncbi:MAG: hypothetical protein E7279_09860 [Lachnospiraceae bacterium]|nr:hypothetical protein [Lachnospiraceae bacterium]
MFLNRLTLAEKEAFVSLAVHAANANGIAEDKEYEIIEEYCKEMGISFFDAKNVIDMDRIINVFKDAEEMHKKIALLETLGLLYADGSYDDKEKKFVTDYANRIGLNDSDVEIQDGLINRYLDLIKEMCETLQ